MTETDKGQQSSIGVIGTGLMGSSIAAMMCAAAIPVRVFAKPPWPGVN